MKQQVENDLAKARDAAAANDAFLLNRLAPSNGARPQPAVQPGFQGPQGGIGLGHETGYGTPYVSIPERQATGQVDLSAGPSKTERGTTEGKPIPADDVRTVNRSPVTSVTFANDGVYSAFANISWQALATTYDPTIRHDLPALVQETLTVLKTTGLSAPEPALNEVEKERHAASERENVAASIKADLRKYPGDVVRLTLVVGDVLPGDAVEELNTIWNRWDSAQSIWQLSPYTANFASDKNNTAIWLASRNHTRPLGNGERLKIPASIPIGRFRVVGTLVVGSIEFTPGERKLMSIIRETYTSNLNQLAQAIQSKKVVAAEAVIRRAAYQKQRDTALETVSCSTESRCPLVALFSDADEVTGWKAGERHTLTAVIREVSITPLSIQPIGESAKCLKTMDTQLGRLRFDGRMLSANESTTQPTSQPAR
jgi:hypothetical protein